MAGPGHPALRPPELRGRVAPYRLRGGPGADPTRGPLPMGRTLVTEQEITAAGEPALLQVTAVPERGLLDSLVVRRRDLAPIREHELVRGRSIEVTFAGRHIAWVWRAADGTEQAGDTTYRVPVFAFNQLEMLVRALESEPGRRIVVPMVSEGSAEMELDTLWLESAGDSIRRIRFADSAVTSQYQLTGPARDVAQLEIRIRDGASYTRIADPDSSSSGSPAR